MKKETKVWLDIAHEDYDNLHYMQKGKKTARSLVMAERIYVWMLKKFKDN